MKKTLRIFSSAFLLTSVALTAPLTSSARQAVTSSSGVTAPAHITKLSASTYLSVVEQNEKPVVVDVYATWCGPCKKLAPIFYALGEEFQDKVTFAQLDIDQERALARQLSVSSMPTLLFYKDGKLVGRHSGLLSKAALRAKLEELCQSSSL